MLAVSCQTPSRDIQSVLADHQHELLAKPGIIGVYIGLLPDQRTTCIKVMLARPDTELEHSLPHKIEGYSVVPEVTGPIQPMR